MQLLCTMAHCAQGLRAEQVMICNLAVLLVTSGHDNYPTDQLFLQVQALKLAQSEILLSSQGLLRKYRRAKR